MDGQKEENNQFPLYPKLQKGGDEEAVELIEAFKKKLSEAADEAISSLYYDILPHIETNAWSNFRGDLLDGFRNYNNRKIQSPEDFKIIRQAIFEQFHDEIIEDLNQDLVKENKELKEWVDRLLKYR